MVLASVNIADAISIILRPDKQSLRIRFSDKSLDPKQNTVQKTIELLWAEGLVFGADIRIRKGIPIGGGMGGSSADAAGVLIGLDRLLGLRQKGISLQAIAGKVGSDVPYMLRGGFQRVTGIGDCLRPLRNDPAKRIPVLLCRQAGGGLLTKDVFAAHDRICPDIFYAPSDNGRIAEALLQGDIPSLGACLSNGLYPAAATLDNSLPGIYNALLANGALAACMTGSGNVMTGLFGNEASAVLAANRLRKQKLLAAPCFLLPHGYEITFLA